MKNKKLASLLKQARAKSGLSLRDIEKRAVVANGYFSRMERGLAGEINPKKLRLIASLLKLDYIQLMTLAGYLTRSELNALHKDCGVC